MTQRVHRIIHGGLYLLGAGLLLLAVLLMVGCQSSKITPATTEATRTSENKGPRTVWRMTVTPKEAK